MNTLLPRARSVDDLSEPGSALKRLVRLLRPDVGVLRGLSWRRVGYTVLVAAGFALWAAFGSWIRRKYGSGYRPVGIADFFFKPWGLLSTFQVVLFMFFLQMLALTIADNLHISRVQRSVLLVVALVLATTVASEIIAMSDKYTDSSMAWGLTWGGLVAFVYFKRRRDEELAAALHAAQLSQVELRKKVLGSQMQLIQAQVEPHFLFNTLRQVGDLYETDRPAADRMLDNMILYLRAALPQMRTSSSTLGQEVQLAQAYLNIERIHLHDRLDFAFDVPEALGSAAFPPMMLLPLIEAIALRAPNGSDYAGALRIEARATAGELELALVHTGDGHPATDQLENIRGRLSALYGAGAKLKVEPLTPRGTIASLRIPSYVAA